MVKCTHRVQIHNLISEETDKPVGHPDWLKHYPATLSKVVDGFTEAEVADAEKMAQEWSNEGAPREVQRM